VQNIFIFSGIALLLFWAVCCTEMSYFGRFSTKFLYNLFSPLYELKWRTNKYSDKKILKSIFSDPVKKIIETQKQNGQVTEILDLACGTGRFSQIVLKNNWMEKKEDFQQREIKIKALDFSQGMLENFRKKLKKLKDLDLIDPDYQKIIALKKQDLNSWKPSKDEYEKYHVVSLLEAGEFIPNFVELVSQISKTLKPGGLFMLTKPPDSLAWTYFFRRQTRKKLEELLITSQFEKIRILSWTSRYEVVWANKKL